MSDQAGQLSIRAATADDLAQIVAIERSAFTLPWSHHSFATLVGAPETEFLVAEAESGLCGYAVLFVVGDESELANLAVVQDGRRRGVGRRLLNESIARGSARGAQRMFLEVRESNRAAQALYESAGFTLVSRRRRYYEEPREDALVMRLHIKDHHARPGSRATK